jgi:hypothetical protein
MKWMHMEEVLSFHLQIQLPNHWMDFNEILTAHLTVVHVSELKAGMVSGVHVNDIVCEL